MSDEQKISQRYRELAREEPPRHVDDAILAASRRAVHTRPAPLVVPSGRRRWYFPLAAAAVIVLAVAVTVHVERERPDAEPVMQAQTAPESQVAEARKDPPPKVGAKRELYAPDPKPAPREEQAAGAAADSRESRANRDAEGLADLQKAQKPAAPASPAPPPAAAPSPPARAAPPQDAVAGMREFRRADEAPKPQARMEAQSVMRQKATVGAASAFAAASPEQWLQGIDDLKRQGRHEEAERELAEFRKRYPDYRIPEAITEKFEKR
jgi:hypothetical protein